MFNDRRTPKIEKTCFQVAAKTVLSLNMTWTTAVIFEISVLFISETQQQLREEYEVLS